MTLQEDAPAEYSAVIDELVASGFIQQVGDPDAADFGNQLVLLIHDDVRLRMVRDRGEWSLEIAVPFTDEWFAPVVWMALLNDRLPDPRPLSRETEARFVLSSWREFAVPDHVTTLAALTVWRARRAEQRRSQPPQEAV